MMISSALIAESRDVPVCGTGLLVKYRTIPIDGIRMFYREAGPRDAPVIVLLHGFPSSSRMFATLLPRLADEFHVIAPDYPGFGHSDAPPPERFEYTFDHLARCVEQLVDALGVARYALYVHDYGGPVGFRIAAARLERITALVVQNAVIHIEGLSGAWDVRKAFWENRAVYEAKLRESLLSADVARQRHLAGVADPENIDPDTWTDEFAFLTRPGMDRIQLDLMFDYRTNVENYPRWQAYLRDYRPPTLVVWGKHDPLFTIAGVQAFRREVPDAEIHLLNASHFALDETVDVVAALMRRFLLAARRDTAPG